MSPEDNLEFTQATGTLATAPETTASLQYHYLN
jgi:hypothetical protein